MIHTRTGCARDPRRMKEIKRADALALSCSLALSLASSGVRRATWGEEPGDRDHVSLSLSRLQPSSSYALRTTLLYAQLPTASMPLFLLIEKE